MNRRRVSVALAVLGLCAGCMTIEAGKPVAPVRLEARLKIGESTARDVRQVLGPPAGKGSALLPIHDGPRTVWAYYYEYSNVFGTKFLRYGRTYLWIYLDGDKYDGYMWFSSLPDDVRRRKGAQTP